VKCAISPTIFHLIESFFVGNVGSEKEIFLLQIMSVVCWVTYWRNEADASLQWRRFKRSAPSQPSGVASAAAPPGGALSHCVLS
jgi:hypothetical protein